MVSDPSLRTATPANRSSFDASEGALPVTRDWPSEVAETRRRHRWWIYGTLALVSTAVALRLLASVVASPLDTIASGAAPAWQVEVTTNGNKPGIALAYGREVGIQLLRIPSGESGSSEPRVVPARLARGELHLITLSYNALRVHAPGVPGSGVVEFTATSPIITAFQTPEASGVRAGW